MAKTKTRKGIFLVNHRKRIRVIFIVLGCCCVIAATALGVYNKWSSEQAGNASKELTDAFADLLAAGLPTYTGEGTVADGPTGEIDAGLEDMPELETEEIDSIPIGGYNICGSIKMPTINRELAVIADWSYSKLKITACRYTGTPDTRMIIMAHNFDQHFGRISNLKAGDTVLFTSVDGTVYTYSVSGTEVWATNQLAEVLNGDWDLTLFTCTYGGANRVVVRCTRELG